MKYWAPRQDQNLTRDYILDQILQSEDSTEPRSDRSTEVEVLHSGLTITRMASESRLDQKSDSEKRGQQSGSRSDQQPRVDPDVQPDTDLKSALETNQKLCLKPDKTRTLESGLGSDLKLWCGPDSGSISEEMTNITSDLEPEPLSDLRIELPSVSDLVAPNEPALAENLQPGSITTQTTDLGSEKRTAVTRVLHHGIRSNGTTGSGSDLKSPPRTQETEEPETLSRSEQRPGPESDVLPEQNLIPDPRSYQRIKSDIRSNLKAPLQSSKTLRSESILGDTNLRSESNQNEIRNVQSGVGVCQTTFPLSGFRLNLHSVPSAEENRDVQPEARSGEQLDVQTGLDQKSPESEPDSETTSDLKNSLKSAETKTSKPGLWSEAPQSGSGETSNVHLRSDLNAEPEGDLRMESPSVSGFTLTETQRRTVDTTNRHPDPHFHSKEVRELLFELGHSQRLGSQSNVQPGVDPPPRPGSQQEEKPASRPKEASPVETRSLRAEPESQVRLLTNQQAELDQRFVPLEVGLCLVRLLRVKMQLCLS